MRISTQSGGVQVVDSVIKMFVGAEENIMKAEGVRKN
jgi:hypothetical protein